MKQIDALLKKIDWSKTIEEQLDVLKLFDFLSGSEISELTSTRYVKSFEAGIVIRYLGPTHFINHISDLLIYLQDINWPAAPYAGSVLREMGRLAIPSIREAFKVDTDSIWHYWILEHICAGWDKATNTELSDEYLKLVKKADREGASLAALRILSNILSIEDFRRQADYLSKEFQDDENWVRELEGMLADIKASR